MKDTAKFLIFIGTTLTIIYLFGKMVSLGPIILMIGIIMFVIAMVMENRNR